MSHRLALNRHGIFVLFAGLLPFAAAHACSTTGKLAGLVRYAGTYSPDTSVPLDKAPAILARLERLPQSVRRHLERNLDVRGPVDLIDCHLVLSGNAEHQGGMENAILDANLYSGAVTVAILSGGRITIYLDKDPTASASNPVPRPVLWWATMAAMGFRAQELPPGARIVKAP